MLMIICEVIFWVVFVYGFLSLFQDIFNEITYSRINHDMKILIIARNIEDKIDEFINEFNFIKKSTSRKNVTVIDLSEKDNIEFIDKKLKEEEINWSLLNCNKGKEFIDNQFINLKN